MNKRYGMSEFGHRSVSRKYAESMLLGYSIFIPYATIIKKLHPETVLTISTIVAATSLLSYHMDKAPSFLRSAFFVATLRSRMFKTAMDNAEIISDFEELKKKAGIHSDTKIFYSNKAGDDNAFTNGRDVFIGKKLRDSLNRRELKSIIAHEIAHIKTRDMSISTPLALPLGYPALGMFGITLFATPILAIMAYAKITDPDTFKYAVDKLLPLVPFITATIPAYIGTSFAFNRISREFEYRADENAVKLTGDVDASIDFFKKIEKEGLNEPNLLFKILGTHPTSKQRIERLEKIKASSNFPSPQ